jgi:PPOX class F420-dependent enzyme/OxyR family protein
MSFTEEEIGYLRIQRLARIATVAGDGQPDVMPVGYQFDGEYFYVGGMNPAKTRKFRNVRSGNTSVALIIDDLVSVNPCGSMAALNSSPRRKASSGQVSTCGLRPLFRGAGT